MIFKHNFTAFISFSKKWVNTTVVIFTHNAMKFNFALQILVHITLFPKGSKLFRFDSVTGCFYVLCSCFYSSSDDHRWEPAWLHIQFNFEKRNIVYLVVFLSPCCYLNPKGFSKNSTKTYENKWCQETDTLLLNKTHLLLK